jgi:hypothetical protein
MTAQAVLTTVLFISPLLAQDSEVAGLVKDPNGALVPGAALKIRNPETRAERVTMSNSSGAYFFPAMSPATYEMEVSKPGFQTLVRTNLRLEVGQRAQVDFRIQLGEHTQKPRMRPCPRSSTGNSSRTCRATGEACRR